MNTNYSDFRNLNTNLQMFLVQSVPQPRDPETMGNTVLNNQSTLLLHCYFYYYLLVLLPSKFRPVSFQPPHHFSFQNLFIVITVIILNNKKVRYF